MCNNFDMHHTPKIILEITKKIVFYWIWGPELYRDRYRTQTVRLSWWDFSEDDRFEFNNNEPQHCYGSTKDNDLEPRNGKGGKIFYKLKPGSIPWLFDHSNQFVHVQSIQLKIIKNSNDKDRFKIKSFLMTKFCKMLHFILNRSTKNNIQKNKAPILR
jgi:hypothetical protein